MDAEREARADFSTLQAEAREAGYALILYGSLMRDVDVIAVPWREAHDEEALVDVFRRAARFIDHDETDWRGWRSFIAWMGKFRADPHDGRLDARYFDVKVARVAAASEWCRADQTRAIVEWLREAKPTAVATGIHRYTANDIEAEFPSPEQSGQAPSEQEERDD